MSISKTPRNKETDSIFSNPTAQLFEDVDGENKTKLEDDRVEKLEKELQEMRDRYAEERSDAQLSQPSTNNWQSQVQDVEVKPETIALPDPALDPDGYAVALQKRVELSAENTRRRQDRDRRFEKDIDDKTSELWADFGEDYPELSENRERIDYIATKVVKAAVKKGLDINRYMFGTGRARFMKDVANGYVKVFGEPETEEDNENDYRSTSRTARRARSSNRSREENDEGRSAGVFGGNESGGRPNSRNVDPEEGPSMIDDIHAIQRKTGFF